MRNFKCISTSFPGISTNSFGSIFLTPYVCTVQMNETPYMKKLVYIIAITVFAVSFTSCGASRNFQKENTEVAGYTLKGKKEQFQQKIASKKVKTVIATP
tara:strand:+ start:522 stop:821 length:300 start_codon:yes stop_codon:yes gene_type:complete